MALLRVVYIICLMGIIGCGDSGPTVDPTPLSMDQWRSMPKTEKYENHTVERLKASNPELQTDTGWDKFMREILMPDRRQDFPEEVGKRNNIPGS